MVGVHVDGIGPSRVDLLDLLKKRAPYLLFGLGNRRTHRFKYAEVRIREICASERRRRLWPDEKPVEIDERINREILNIVGHLKVDDGRSPRGEKERISALL